MYHRDPFGAGLIEGFIRFPALFIFAFDSRSIY